MCLARFGGASLEMGHTEATMHGFVCGLDREKDDKVERLTGVFLVSVARRGQCVAAGGGRGHERSWEMGFGHEFVLLGVTVWSCSPLCEDI
jgi:hypothetical protein